MRVSRSLILAGAVLASLVIASAADAQAITDPTAPPAPPAEKAQRAPSPFSFTAAYTADILADVSGGQAPGEAWIDLVKVSAAFDGAAAGRDGFTGLISVEHANGADFTGRRVGGFQALSSAEAQPGALRLYEAWVQKEILDGKGGVKTGLIDLNTTFDVQETAALFLNSSDGTGPDLADTGLNDPSIYPTTALAATAFYRPAEGWTAQLGIFDSVAGDPDARGRFVAIKLDGALIIGQVEKRFGDAARIEGGAWTYTNAFASLDQFDAPGRARQVHGNGGVYALAEGRLAGRPGVEGAGLSGWLRIGFANGDINRADSYLGAGLVYTGLIAGRDKDEIGLAVNRAGFGDGARYAGGLLGRQIADAETDFEATYRYAFKDWLNIQPDVQWVIHPDGDARLRNAVVVGLRLAFTVSK